MLVAPALFKSAWSLARSSIPEVIEFREERWMRKNLWDLSPRHSIWYREPSWQAHQRHPHHRRFLSVPLSPTGTR